jgi:Putative transposase
VQKQNFVSWLSRIVQSEWVVYAKPPFGGPRQVLKYLARYTHRVAIANQRLVALQDGHVSFRWKDYTHAGQLAVMKLEATEFIRRFLLHVLPRGFVKIRHFGFLANRGRDDHLRLCRTLLAKAALNLPDDPVTGQAQLNRPDHCPLCSEGRMRPVEILLPQAALRVRPCIPSAVAALEADTS